MKPLFVFLALSFTACAPVAVETVQRPPELLNFYRDADAYQAGAESRLCADPSLRPAFEQLRARMTAAKALLIGRFGEAAVSSVRVPVVINPQDFCANRVAAATAVRTFEASLSNLEAALK